MEAVQRRAAVAVVMDIAAMVIMWGEAAVEDENDGDMFLQWVVGGWQWFVTVEMFKVTCIRNQPFVFFFS